MSFNEGNLHERVKRLEEENGKLRDLVKCYTDVPCRCAYCEYDKRKDGGEGCELFGRAIELGVDV